MAPATVPLVRLFVANAMCDASLDERPSSKTPPTTYNDITPGLHKIFCTIEGNKALVDAVTFEAGRPYVLNIRVINGKPTLIGRATKPGHADPGLDGKGGLGSPSPR